MTLFRDMDQGLRRADVLMTSPSVRIKVDTSHAMKAMKKLGAEAAKVARVKIASINYHANIAEEMGRHAPQESWPNEAYAISSVEIATGKDLDELASHLGIRRAHGLVHLKTDTEHRVYFENSPRGTRTWLQQTVEGFNDVLACEISEGPESGLVQVVVDLSDRICSLAHSELVSREIEAVVQADAPAGVQMRVFDRHWSLVTAQGEWIAVELIGDRGPVSSIPGAVDLPMPDYRPEAAVNCHGAWCDDWEFNA